MVSIPNLSFSLNKIRQVEKGLWKANTLAREITE